MLAIITPYRHRSAHLQRFLTHYKDMQVFVIEQADNKHFNRAKLFNVAADLLTNGVIPNEFTHFVFSDVDMLADDKSIFTPCDVAHLAGQASQFRYKLPYPTFFGGVAMISKEVFLKVDGFSNDFWGWGSEDDEMYNNLVNNGFQVEYRAGRFKSLVHNPADRSHHPKNILRNLAGRQLNDGLKCCEYELKEIKKTTYTHIKVEL